MPALACVGCEPIATFEPYVVRHPLNLEKILGREVTLIGPDTLPLTIRFDPTTGRNSLISKAAHDTLTDAWVTRYRGLYYFTEPRDGGRYYLVHAARIRRGQVQGLTRGEAFRQAEVLADHLTSPPARLLGSDYDELVLRRNEQQEVLHLRYDARVLRPFFVAVVDTLPVYRLGRPAPSGNPPAPAPADLVCSMYPNPAHGAVRVQLSRPASVTLELLDAQGRRLQQVQYEAADQLTLALDGVPAGVYVLRLYEAEGHARTSRRLVVE